MSTRSVEIKKGEHGGHTLSVDGHPIQHMAGGLRMELRPGRIPLVEVDLNPIDVTTHVDADVRWLVCGQRIRGVVLEDGRTVDISKLVEGDVS